ncbi:MAG: trigger factor, partial [Thermosynechococcaceae cyanobacterium]
MSTKEALKVTWEKRPGSQISLEIEISPARSQRVYDQKINEFMRTIQIPGFRRGKIPGQVIMQRVGTLQLKATVLEELVNQTLQEALVQEKIQSVGNLDLDKPFEELLEQFELGQSFTYSGSIDIRPEPTLPDYQNLAVQVEEVVYNPDQVDQILEKHRSERATFIPVEGRSAELGDVVLVDFVSQYFLDEEKTELTDLEGGDVKDFRLELTEGQFLPGFADAVVGMNPDETKEVDLPLLAGYVQDDLVDKVAHFTITLKEIKTKELPELDDAFAQEISEFQTLDALRAFLENRYRQEAEAQTQTKISAALIEALTQEMEVDLPETAIINETNRFINQIAQQIQMQGIDANAWVEKETLPVLQARYRKEAIDRLRGS